MPQGPQRFGIYLIGQRADGEPVRLDRSVGETVLLAFDTTRKRLVELHVLNQGMPLNAASRQSALDRMEQARELRGLSFMRLLGHGEEDGALYYSTNLNDGEPVASYIQRRGALSAVTAFALMQSYLDDLVEAKKQARLMSCMNVASPLVTTQEDAFLQLRLTDFGLNQAEPVDLMESGRRLVVDSCQLLFHLLAGQSYEGQNPDRFPALTSLPTNLRTTLRAALSDADHAPSSLEKLRDDVREAYATQVPNLQLRSSRRHLMLQEALHPRSHVQNILLDMAPLDQALKGRFEVMNEAERELHPFVIQAVQTKDRLPVTVHVLPPSRIADKEQYDAVPLQMWRFNSAAHPNILRSLSLWETPDWTFLTEEREPGFPLSRLLAERSTLNPAEVALILRQVRAGLEQAKECGVMKADIHPSNLTLKVGKDGMLQGREHERLMQKRMDVWPPFTVKIRTHATMRSLYEPQLVEPLFDDASQDSFVHERDSKNRSFAALAIYLLCGERNVGSRSLVFGEAVPEPLAAWLRSVAEMGHQLGATPSVGDFLEEFEKLMTAPVPEPRALSSFASASAIPIEEMESAGSVSDFAEDWTEDEPEPDPLPNYTVPRTPVKPALFKTGAASFASQTSRKSSRGTVGMALWAFGTVVLLLLGWFTLFRSAAADSGVTADVPAAPAVRETGVTPVVGDQSLPTNSRPPPRGPEMIKKAIVPPVWEVERLRRGEDAPAPAPADDKMKSKSQGMVDATAPN